MDRARKISIQIIEDYTLIRKSLNCIFNTDNKFKVTNCFNSIYEYLQQQTPNSPADIVLADTETCGHDSYEIIKELKNFSPHTKIVLISSKDNDCIPGASCCISLENKYEDIVKTVKALFD